MLYGTVYQHLSSNQYAVAVSVVFVVTIPLRSSSFERFKCQKYQAATHQITLKMQQNFFSEGFCPGPVWPGSL